MTNQNEVAKKDSFQTSLTKVTNIYMPMVADTLEGNEIAMTDYQRQVVMSAIGVIDDLLKNKGKKWNEVDQGSVSDALMKTATLQLNPSADPSEVYYITRDKKVNGKWTTILEMGIEGDGNDSLLARFGRDVKMVHKYWEVREDDDYEGPSYYGIEVTPPKWTPKGTGKVVRVVYPITKTDGEVEYLVSEREDVAKNLKAHINNNLMNETFGIAKDRYNATPKQKQEIDARKKAIVDLFRDMPLEKMLTNEVLEPYISPAWKDPHSSESMIVRKMRNNAVKKYPKNFENAFLSRVFNDASEGTETVNRRDVTEDTEEKAQDLLTAFKASKKEEDQVEYKNQAGEVISENDEVPMTEENVKENQQAEQENEAEYADYEEVNEDWFPPKDAVAETADFSNLKVPQIKERLDKLGVKYDSNARKPELEGLLEMATSGGVQDDLF